MTNITKEKIGPTVTLFLLFNIFNFSVALRVCPTWVDYINENSTSCSYSDDADLNVTQLLKKYCDANVEEYSVTTDDGYILSVIKAFKIANNDTTPVIFGHGIYSDSTSFVSVGSTSIACEVIKDNQAWFINFRGTRSSKTHRTLNSSQYDYWKFSFHEIAIYDLRQSLQFIYEKSGNRSMIYIGYSMGNTVGLIYNSLYPAEAKNKLKGNIFLAPVGSFDNTVKSILGAFACEWPLVVPFVQSIFNGELLKRNDYVLSFCSNNTVGLWICEVVKALVFGDDFEQIDPSTRPITNWLNPDSIGQNVVTHYAQWICSKKACYMDYGSVQNLVTYGSVTPPCYDFSKVQVSTSLFVGNNDWLATTDNAVKLYSSFTPSVRCGYFTLNYPKWNHNDFILATNILQLEIQPVKQSILQMENNLCNVLLV